ncbi:uncharacterized protein LOC110110717 [Dendrobium catenatum]|uniref:RNA exonuclease 1 n=1 Tax=Dendrobium catenatum TaxID=906689 RepID=A0A2I0W0X4_9ASPA|nr:uncharacterized protein LOC110110717 [Dendrobium catenatum]PKU69312.1 RNA exonuclease 1 [Dendrobium catenatum]
MDSSLLPSAFPPLASSSGIGARSTPKDWSQVFVSGNSTLNSIKFSHFPEEPDVIPFSGDKLQQGGEDWKLCLVGYSIGRRPYYEALLGAIKKTWSLKGSVQLLSLSDGFFLLRFSCCEDFDMVWSRGVWFLLGKPFVLQKWHPKFTPMKEDFSSVPIWVKIHNLPLACWNSEGMSRIASKIGIPLAADNLTEQKTRLTFARICVLVDRNATYPEEIKVSLDGDVVCLKVQYEWRPSPCEHCKSLMHYSSSCPSQPDKENNEKDKMATNFRGRSNSRKPRKRSFSNNNRVSRPPVHTIAKPIIPESAAVTTDIHDPPSSNLVASIQIPNAQGIPLLYQPHSPSASPSGFPKSQRTQIAENPVGNDIPNLNSICEEASSSSSLLFVKPSSLQPEITSPNKFDALNIEEDSCSQLDPILDSNSDRQNEDFEEVKSKNSKASQKSKVPNSGAVSKKSAKGKQVKKPQHLSNS